jgi:hypothetical protein
LADEEDNPLTSTLINALVRKLSPHLCLRKSRLESFCVLISGVLISRTVNLSHLAAGFPGHAEIASNYRRLQRFFEQVRLRDSDLARLIARLARLGQAPWLLVLDRTNWQLGRRHVNILTLAAVSGEIAVPLFWTVMDRPGNATQDQREALLERFCATFGSAAVAGLIADREFSTASFMRFLAERRIPFFLRVKESCHVRPLGKRRHIGQVRTLFRALAKGDKRCLTGECVLGQRKAHQGPAVSLAALRLDSGELLVVATNANPDAALAIYRRRWTIETLFAAFKTRGFNLEDTHIVDTGRIAKMMGVLAVAFAFAFAAGKRRASQRPIAKKAHNRKAHSLFRYGLDRLRAFLLNQPDRAISLCAAIIGHNHPTAPPGAVTLNSTAI